MWDQLRGLWWIDQPLTRVGAPGSPPLPVGAQVLKGRGRGTTRLSTRASSSLTASTPAPQRPFLQGHPAATLLVPCVYLMRWGAPYGQASCPALATQP